MFPEPPTPTIEWSNVGLQGFDETVHIEATYSCEDEEWTALSVIRDPWVKVHGLSPALNYGQQCFEGMRATRSSDNQILLFRPEQHARRLAHSADIVSMPPVPQQLFLDCIHAAVRENSAFVPPRDIDAMLYIRPVLFGSGPQLLLYPATEFKFCVYVQPLQAMYGSSGVDAVVLEDFDRSAPRGTGNAKVGGNYAPIMKWSAKAQAGGFSLMLHLDSATRTEVEEFSSSAFAGIKVKGSGVPVLVLASSPNVIQSVTADTCFEVARSLGWRVEKRTVKWDEVATFDEVVAMGTATLLLSINSLTRRSTGQRLDFSQRASAPDNCCETLRAAVQDVMRGNKPAPQGWLVPVTKMGERSVVESGAVKARL